MKIQTQFLVIIFSLILIVGLNVTMISETVSKNIVEQEIYNHLESTAQSRANHVETFLESQKTTVHQLSQSIVIQKLLLTAKNDEEYAKALNDVTKRLKSRVEIGKDTYGVFVLDKEGIIIASNEEADIGKDKSNCSCFSGGRQGVFVKDVYSETEGTGSLAFSAPILDDNNEFSGVVVMVVSAEALNEITTNTAGFGETEEVYLVNKDGYMITPSRFVNDTFLKQKVDTENTRNCFADIERFGTQEHEEAAVLFNSYRDTDVLGIHAPIPETQWCLLAEMSEEESFAPLAKLTQVMLMLLAFLSAVGMILSILISRTITKPIVQLHHGTEEIEKGNLDYKVGTGAKDEIGQLSRAFDSMTAKLKKSREELEEYSKGLEKLVEERTNELDAKVKEVELQRVATLNLLGDVNETKMELERAKEGFEKTNIKLERSNKELQDFAYIASHDLQEPLRKISGFGLLLQDSLEGKLDEDEQENFAIMLDGVNRMQQMIDDMLTYSRITTKAKPAEREDLNEVIEDLKNVELAVLLEETGGTIRVPEPLLAVQADPSQMHQLLQNLIGNGLKYHREGIAPEIIVRSRRESDIMVRVEVEDNGIGIDEKNYEQVFGMFQRLHSREEYGGTGIGLAICKKIAERHGGSIGLSSTPGKGSTFWFTLPVDKGEERREKGEGRGEKGEGRGE